MNGEEVSTRPVGPGRDTRWGRGGEDTFGEMKKYSKTAVGDPAERRREEGRGKAVCNPHLLPLPPLGGVWWRGWLAVVGEWSGVEGRVEVSSPLASHCSGVHCCDTHTAPSRLQPPLPTLFPLFLPNQPRTHTS